MCRFPHLLHIKSLFLPLSVTQYQHTRLPRLEGGKRGGRGEEGLSKPRQVSLSREWRTVYFSSFDRGVFVRIFFWNGDIGIGRLFSCWISHFSHICKNLKSALTQSNLNWTFFVLKVNPGKYIYFKVSPGKYIYIYLPGLSIYLLRSTLAISILMGTMLCSLMTWQNCSG